MGFYKNVGSIKERLKKLLKNIGYRSRHSCEWDDILVGGNYHMDYDNKHYALDITYGRKDKYTPINVHYHIPILQTNIISILVDVLSSQDVDSMYMEFSIGGYGISGSKDTNYYTYVLYIRDILTDDIIYRLDIRFNILVNERKFLIKPKYIELLKNGKSLDIIRDFDIVKV